MDYNLFTLKCGFKAYTTYTYARWPLSMPIKYLFSNFKISGGLLKYFKIKRMANAICIGHSHTPLLAHLVKGVLTIITDNAWSLPPSLSLLLSYAHSTPINLSLLLFFPMNLSLSLSPFNWSTNDLLLYMGWWDKRRGVVLITLEREPSSQVGGRTRPFASLSSPFI